MSLMMIVFLFLFLLLMSLAGGVLVFKRHRVLGLILVGVPLAVFAGVFFLYKWFSYETTPQSLDLQVTREGDAYLLEGKWRGRLDPDSFWTDFIVFHLPEGSEVHVTQIKEAKPDPAFYDLTDEVSRVVDQNPNTPDNSQIQMFALKLEKTFQVRFALPDQLRLEDVTIQYVHVVYPPMDPLFYWVKTYNGEVPDPPGYTR
ncbi:hypothetical protein ACI7RC_25010 [Brevibacillus sp. B_LB10_24]|uniref:hypothetical protein n=1 Tax=Brevibacillus sp. B_LB10_24 TaxID=3380645 RepID=UPI0038BB73F9